MDNDDLDTTNLYTDRGGRKRRLMDEAMRLSGRLDYLVYCVSSGLEWARVKRLANLAQRRYQRRYNAYFKRETH